MTTNDQQPATYPWRAAPSHLRTRRQLRAAGLSPGGQDVAALMVGKRRGRRLTAFLFDIALARPKRTPSPAQLEAIEKATRTHQLQAAERRGWTATELHTPTDLGPAWSETTTQEETIVNTNDPAAAQPVPSPPAEPMRTQGRGQGVAWLHALVATNRARHRRERLDADLERAARAGAEVEAEVMAELQHDLDNAETWLAAVRGIGDPYSDAILLADALYWAPGSPLATDVAERITTRLATEWGVRVDPETWDVTVDPDFDAVAAQTAAETRAARAREAAIVDVVAGLALPDHTAAEVNWTVQAWAAATPPSSEDLSQRREELRADLAGVRCTEGDRALLEFTVDYLTGHTAEVDLLDTPVLVDPGLEVRGRIPRLLGGFAEGRIAPAEVAEEISVMTAEDQQDVREVGASNLHELDMIEFQVWPGWADRDRISKQLHQYATEAEEHFADVDYLATADLTVQERDRLGVDDKIGYRIGRLNEARLELFETAETAVGLTAVERHHLTAVIRDIDNGEPGLPELMWVDERSKAAADDARSYRPGIRLSQELKEGITQMLLVGEGIDLNDRHHTELRHSVSSLGDTVYSVARGSELGLDHTRQAFLTERANLGRRLAATGIGAAAMTAVREVVDSRAREAGQCGQVAIDRRGRWRDRIDGIVAARDDSLAQRRAAATGHSASTGRVCTAGTAVTASSAIGPAHSPRIRNLHGEEIGR